eukprot:comp14618_c0_seq1/m.21266 comp14618_c0_seq1/g.21266  ORF comp14618_c0_seq1/g.21266 comp14618_c0_seq1/m.21266 type:complete len:165 (-) comp14618_c0_seq1:29-523(-)
MDSTAETPLYGERSQSRHTFYWLTGVLCTGLTVATALCLCIKGLKHPEHFVLAAAVIFLNCLWALIIKWYRNGDLDPKFKTYTWALGFATVLVCIAGIMYTFSKEFNPKTPEPPPKSHCVGFESVDNPGKCLSDLCANTANKCIYFRQPNWICVPCGNATSTVF